MTICGDRPLRCERRLPHYHVLRNPISPTLIPDLAHFAALGKRVKLAFDQDSKPETRSKVEQALGKFGGLLVAAGCEVTVAHWNPE